jgi:mannose-6-phosphate isomerase-like protein (cupin superfamily)
VLALGDFIVDRRFRATAQLTVGARAVTQRAHAVLFNRLSDHRQDLIVKKKTLRFGKGFKVLISNRRVQAAQMVIGPGDSEGHRGADQWLFVLAGTGAAIVGGRQHALKAHTLLLIEQGERHEIKNTGRVSLKTINFYSPPGYTKAGDELPRARP